MTAHVDTVATAGSQALSVDRLASLLLTPSRDADAALLAEGVAPSAIRFVGNVMIDSVRDALPRARALRPATAGVHVLVTLHRP